MAISGPIPAGSPKVSASGFAMSATFDHRGSADFLQVRFRLRLIFLDKHLVADFFLLRRVDGGWLSRAQRHHFHALLGHLGRSEMPDRSLVEQFAKNLRYVGRGFGHAVADRGVLHALEERIGVLTGLHAAAQRFGLLLPGFRSEEHTSELQSLTNLVC